MPRPGWKDEMKVHVKVVADVPVIANKTNDVISVLYGESVSLQCSAKGEPTPLILWFSPTNSHNFRFRQIFYT